MNNPLINALLHPASMTILGIILWPIISIFGWHTWFSYALDFYQAVHDAPIALILKSTMRSSGLH